MEKIINDYKTHFKRREFIFSIILSMVMLTVSLFVNFYAGMYATNQASNFVTDIFLSNIRTFDVDGLFVYGGFSLFIVIGLFCVTNPKKIPFTIKSISLFVVVRSIFVSLTHLGPFPTQALVPLENIISYVSFTGDLFFSGHTGLPFLMSLIYWDNKIARYFFIGLSLFFGMIVLLGHLHYSIDVLSAFFITFTIFHISKTIFKKDYDVTLQAQV
ncbi:MAG: phosphatase PAP2-related protein [Candidatus Magasanikiibacteriota bacterium]